MQLVRISLSLVALLFSLLPGCASLQDAATGGRPGLKTVVGAGAGGAGGCLLAAAVAGKNPVAIAGGTVVGALTGGLIGNWLDTKDQQLRQAVTRAATAPAGTVVPWNNPRTGSRGTVQSGAWGLGQNGPCRRYTITAQIEGQWQDIEGCAVQRADGTWDIMPER